jgi:hypothetical protein
MTVSITSAQVVSYDKLADVKVNPKHLGQPRSTLGPYLLMILETDTDSIRVINLDQEQVTQLIIESHCATPELFLDIISIFKRHQYSVIYSKHQWGKELRLEVFLREMDIFPLIHDLEELDGITKLEILELFAASE